MSRSLYYHDEELLERIRNEDEAALSYLYKLHYPMILHFVRNNNGTDEDARDIYQEAVIIFYEKVTDGSLDLYCKIKTYLYSVCRRLWLKKLAEKNRFAIIHPLDSETFVALEDETQAAENEKRFTVMSHALALLGEPCRGLIEDFYLNNLSMVEIAAKFGYTNPDNAKNQKYKCLQRLKKIFFSAYKTDTTDEEEVMLTISGQMASFLKGK
jgi:RNA polymerase sigma factor (sigma-70 family)